MLDANIYELTMSVMIDGEEKRFPFELKEDVLGNMTKVPKCLPENLLEITCLSDQMPTFITNLYE